MGSIVPPNEHPSGWINEGDSVRQFGSKLHGRPHPNRVCYSEAMKVRRRLRLLVVIVATTVSCPLSAQLASTMRKELVETKTPGVSVAVVIGERVVLDEGVGVASVETGAPVTSDMLFQIGPCTKMFTAAALLAATEERRLEMEEPVGRTCQDWLRGSPLSRCTSS